MISETAHYIAKILDIPFEKFLQITRTNTNLFYGLPEPD